MIQFIHEAVSYAKKNKCEMAVLHSGVEVRCIAHRATLDDGSVLHQIENLLYSAQGSRFMEVTVFTNDDVPERIVALLHHLEIYKLSIVSI